MELEVAAPSKQRTFYSSAAALVVSINKGRRITDEGGTSKVVDQKVAEFVPQGDGFGRLVTSDQEIIDFMDKRMGITGDVFNAQEYTRRTTPAEIRLKVLEGDHARLVEDHNRLLRKIAEQQSKAGQPSQK